MSGDGDGYTIIPGSRRPDGTYRKDVKVRAGYVNPHEHVYESKGKQVLQRHHFSPLHLQPYDASCIPVVILSAVGEFGERVRSRAGPRGEGDLCGRAAQRAAGAGLVPAAYCSLRRVSLRSVTRSGRRTAPPSRAPPKTAATMCVTTDQEVSPMDWQVYRSATRLVRRRSSSRSEN